MPSHDDKEKKTFDPFSKNQDKVDPLTQEDGENSSQNEETTGGNSYFGTDYFTSGYSSQNNQQTSSHASNFGGGDRDYFGASYFQNHYSNNRYETASPASKKSVLGLLAMILGIVSLVISVICCCVGSILGLPCGIAGLVLGIIATVKEKSSQSIIAIILSAVGILISALIFALLLYAFNEGLVDTTVPPGDGIDSISRLIHLFGK